MELNRQQRFGFKQKIKKEFIIINSQNFDAPEKTLANSNTK